MTRIKKEIDVKLREYLNLSKSVLSKPLGGVEKALGVTMAIGVLGALQSVEAQIVYSGTQNISCNLPVNTNRCYANIDLAGGNDLEIHRNVVGGNGFLQVDEVPGGGFAVDGFLGDTALGYVYPYALASGAAIGPAGPWNFQAGQGNTLADGAGYPGPNWELPAATTRFLGIRSSAPVRYGWVRITVNAFGNYTIVDWAYNNTPNTPINAGQLPTAADASISGRVLSANGRGIARALVTVTDSTGRVLTGRTSTFGHYRIEGIESGGSVVVSVESKGLRFQPRVLTIGNSVTDLDFLPEGSN